MELTIRQVQDRTRLSDIAIRKAITEGRIQYRKEGSHYLIPEEELSKLPKPRAKFGEGKQLGAHQEQKEGFLQGIPFLSMDSTPAPISFQGTFEQNLVQMECFVLGAKAKAKASGASL
jgi:excisionase family DNA binding protein